MFWKRCLDHLTKAVFLTTLLCGSAQLLTGQDSAKVASNDCWKDSATGLVWAIKDNGANVNWDLASEYCRNLRLGGYSDWRLPTIDELEGIYDRSLAKQYKAKGPIELSDSRVWSGTTNASGEVWSFFFSYGGRSPSRTSGHGSAGTALCVRRSGE
jgi:hypothetical protein